MDISTAWIQETWQMKVKVEDDKLLKCPPTIFKDPVLGAPDVRLSVFGAEYHVHSYVLKRNSLFFRKFMDSNEKQPGPASEQFQYEYVAIVDDDNTWCLQPVGAKMSVQADTPSVEKSDSSDSEGEIDEDADSDDEGPQDILTNERTRIPFLPQKYDKYTTIEFQAEGLGKLLSSFYRVPYSFGWYAELGHLVVLADFYCALPAVSSTLSDALSRSKLFGDRGPQQVFSHVAIDFLIPAIKLRHKDLYRECFIHVVGKWSSYRYRGEWIKRDNIMAFPNRVLLDEIFIAREEMSTLIKDATDLLLKITLASKMARSLIRKARDMSLYLDTAQEYANTLNDALTWKEIRCTLPSLLTLDFDNDDETGGGSRADKIKRNQRLKLNVGILTNKIDELLGSNLSLDRIEAQNNYPTSTSHCNHLLCACPMRYPWDGMEIEW